LVRESSSCTLIFFDGADTFSAATLQANASAFTFFPRNCILGTPIKQTPARRF
jgi:hypothetical protein